MNVLIVSTNFCRKDEIAEPYGVCCLVDSFRKNKTQGKIEILNYDLMKLFDKKRNRFQIHFSKVAKKLALKIKKSNCEIVAFSDFAWSDKIFKKTINHISKQNKPFIILGGPMVIGGEEYLRKTYPKVDLFIESYGEKVFSDLQKYIAKSKSSGKKLVKDLPDFEKLDSPYVSGFLKVKENSSVRMELRRGCLFNCAFCRHRNPEKKVFCVGCSKNHKKELEIFKNANVRKINVLDPFFNDLRPEFKQISFEFLKSIKELGIESEISLQIRPEMLDEDYLKIASEMKNLTFEIGIQSLDEKVIPLINRGGKGTREKVIDSLLKVAEYKINCEFTLIYGLPNQTFDSFKSDIEYLKALGFSKISAFPLQIYAGTELFETYKNFGLKVKLNDIGILQVCDNPTQDFKEMQKFVATNWNENCLSNYEDKEFVNSNFRNR